MRVLGREALVCLAFLGLTVVMTWPWVLHVRDSCSDTGDPYLVSWTLWWDFHQTFHDPLHLFDGNIFFPMKYSLAFSEHNYGIALLFFPFLALGMRPLTVHGLAMLFGFAFSGYGAFRLARTLTGSTAGAWVAGVAFAFVPYRFHHIPHLPYVFAVWMPLLAEAVVLFARRRSCPRAIWLGVAFFMSGVSSIHWFLLGSVPTAVMAALLFFEDAPAARRAWGRAVITVGLASLALVPFFLPYQRARSLYGLVRGSGEAAFYSARPIHWLTPDWNLKLWHGMGERPPRGEFCLFPGFLLLTLALIGFLLFLARRSDAGTAGLLFAGLGFVGSFGMSTPFHWLLFHLLPPFQAIRAPVRWAMVADLGLAVLAGVGAAALVEEWSRRRSKVFGLGIAVCLCGALLFEDRVAPLELIRGEADPDEATLFLAKTPMKGGLVELPSGTEDHGNYRAVLRAADHGKPLITAVSGFSSPIVSRIEDDERKVPIPDELLDFLEKIPTSYILVRDSWLSPELRGSHHEWLARGMSAGRLRFVESLRRPRQERPLCRRQERAGREAARPAAVDPDGRALSPPNALPRGSDSRRLHRRTRRGRRRHGSAHGARLGPHQRRGPSRHRHDRRRTAKIHRGRARATSRRPGRPAVRRGLPDGRLRGDVRVRAGGRRHARDPSAVPGIRRPAAPLPAAEIRLETVKRASRDACVLLAFVALTVVMTWPWAAHMRDTSYDPGDSYLNSWTLAWDFHQTFHDPLHLFDSNNFFPYRYTLAFSEHEWGIALLFFPAFAAGLPPLTVHGLAMLFGFAFSGYGAFRLARTLTGSTAGAWVAGVAFAFVPYRFHHIPHLPYVFAVWMPLLAEAVVLFARRRSCPRAIWLGVAFFMSGVSSIHWFLLGSVPTAVMAALLFFEDAPAARRAWGRAVITVGLASLALVPFFLPYQRARSLYGLVRGSGEAAFYSARPIHWLTPDWNLKLWHGMGERPPRGEFCLFPGFLLLTLALIGFLLFLARRSDAGTAGLLFAGLGFVGSFGMSTPFHWLLFHLLPPFQAIRAPVRWAMVADLGLAVLAGVGAAALVEEWSRRRSKVFGLGIAVCLCGALLFEDRVAPLYLHRGEPDPDPLTQFLEKTPMAGGLYELPDEFGETNTLHVLRAADHWKPLVNGYSGFQMPIPQNLHDLLLKGKTTELLDALEAVPVSYVTVRPLRMTPEQKTAAAKLVEAGIASHRLLHVRHFFPDDDLYGVVKIEPDAKPLESAFAANEPGESAGTEWVELTGSIDGPAENATVTGDLAVRGWARIPGRDLGVTVLIDGAPRVPLHQSRFPRTDVQAVLPYLGDCSTAGYEHIFTFQPGDEGEHELSVVFRGPLDRVRHYPSRKFIWKRAP